LALSDCIKCWSTPCECGHEYQDWTEERLKKQIRMLERVLIDKVSARSSNGQSSRALTRRVVGSNPAVRATF
jgi:hypothetical protein